MALNSTYLSLTEKLMGHVNDQNEELEFAFESLTDFLARDIDGFTDHPSDSLAYAVQSRLEEIWSLLSDEDRNRNAPLIELFKRFIKRTERASGYEADIDFPNTCDLEDSIEAEVEAEDECEE
jgi:hypothetical protein